MWQVLAVSVMLEGVGIKLALYEPTASPDAHFAFSQRLLLSLPLFCAYGSVLAQSIFSKNYHHYDREFRWVRHHKGHAVIMLLRVFLLGVTFAIAWAKLQPNVYMLVLAALTFLSTVLQHSHDLKYGIHSDQKARRQPHPLAP
jgi:hypothetical protein